MGFRKFFSSTGLYEHEYKFAKATPDEEMQHLLDRIEKITLQDKRGDCPECGAWMEHIRRTSHWTNQPCRNPFHEDNCSWCNSDDPFTPQIDTVTKHQCKSPWHLRPPATTNKGRKQKQKSETFEEVALKETK